LINVYVSLPNFKNINENVRAIKTVIDGCNFKEIKVMEKILKYEYQFISKITKGNLAIAQHDLPNAVLEYYFSNGLLSRWRIDEKKVKSLFT
jgi:hypothetical protein